MEETTKRVNCLISKESDAILQEYQDNNHFKKKDTALNEILKDYKDLKEKGDSDSKS